MARISVRDLCASTIDFVKNKIISDEFITRHKKEPTDFTRKRSLPFHVLFIFLINLLKSSLQNELDMFFKQIHQTGVPEREVTASALSQARLKLKHQAFIELSHETNNNFYQNYSAKTWHGYRLVAIDGSTVRVPQNDACRKHFGGIKPRLGDHCSMARVSQSYDILNNITIDATIESYHVGERELAARHCQLITSGDLILLDRGYSAFWLFCLILQKRADFTARLTIGSWDFTEKFIASGLNEQVIEINPSAESKKKCLELGLPVNSLKLRLIRVDLEDTQEPEILITSLHDSDLYPHDLFQELYHLRWTIEEDYKLLKCRIEIENFTGKSVEAVQQDFHACIFMHNLTAILAFPVHAEIETNSQKTVHHFKINWTQALAKMRNCGIILFFHDNILSMIEKLHKLFIENVSSVRKGRKFPRNFKPYKKIYSFPYKPIS